MEAKLIAQEIATMLENRATSVVLKSEQSQSKKKWSKGIKTLVSGRLNGAEITRSEDIKTELFLFIH